LKASSYRRTTEAYKTFNFGHLVAVIDMLVSKGITRTQEETNDLEKLQRVRQNVNEEKRTDTIKTTSDDVDLKSYAGTSEISNILNKYTTQPKKQDGGKKKRKNRKTQN